MIAQKDWPKVIVLLTKNIKDERDYVSRSKAYRNLGYYKEALQDSDKALSLD